MKDHVLTTRRGRLSPDLAEKGRQAVIVVLTPAFKGMMMALCTLHTHTQKQLRHIFLLLLRFTHSLVPGHWWIGDDRSRRRQ